MELTIIELHPVVQLLCWVAMYKTVSFMARMGDTDLPGCGWVGHQSEEGET